ncbi:MAG: ATP-dependent DNA ligase [Micropruina sp.]|nr:ATP-dependent DNA ligase [Micropruina sp.]
MPQATQSESQHGVELTNLDQPLFADAQASKRDLIDYLEAVSAPMLRELTDRPLSVMRVRPGQAPFMQKNLPGYAPAFVRWVPVWSEAGHREIRYPLCNDLRTLLWFGNQRAVEYHPTLMVPRFGDTTDVLGGRVTDLVLDLDPPEGSDFSAVVAVAHLVHAALAAAGLRGAVKTSGSKGLHVVVPVRDLDLPDAAAATRALAARTEALDPGIATTAFLKADRGGRVFVDSTRAGGGSLACVFSPRIRPGTPVSYPVPWAVLDDVAPSDFTVTSVPRMWSGDDPWDAILPEPQRVPDAIVAQGHTIPIARVAAMHEGKRRKRAREAKPES